MDVNEELDKVITRIESMLTLCRAWRAGHVETRTIQETIVSHCVFIPYTGMVWAVRFDDVLNAANE